MNESDSQKIANQLIKEKNQPAKKLERADLVIINVCSVRQSAVNRVFSRIKKIRKGNKKAKIILTGCILEKDKKQFNNLVDEIWPITDLKRKTCPPKNKAYLPIMAGCNNFCSYCVVPYTRGREKSEKAEEIIKEAKELIKKGHEEITLLGQNVNSYKSGKYNFPKLLESINNLPGNFKIKFLTSHPKDISDRLIKVIAKSKKISKEIHLPLQSGDNKILKKMNRGYTKEDYLKLIKKIRKAMPKAKISTDIIVGFPQETEKQFQNTVDLIKKISFTHAYIAAYSPRAGTAASKLKDDVSPNEKKRRKKILLGMF